MTKKTKYTVPERIVLVEWIDAMTGDAGWKTLKEVKKQAPVIVHSIGYLVKDDPDFVTVVGSFIPDFGDSDGNVTVPRGMIKSITDLVPKGVA